MIAILISVKLSNKKTHADRCGRRETLIWLLPTLATYRVEKSKSSPAFYSI